MTTTPAIDGYRVVDFVGEGSRGEVWLAQRIDGSQPQYVALKLMKDHLISDQRELARFQREAKALTDVGHPNVAGVYGTGVFDGGKPYIAMEYVHGETLRQRLRRTGYISLAQTFHIAIQLADALDSCHAGGIVHRDVKPQNAKVEPDANGYDRAVLLDFGIAKVADLSISISGTVVGTPAYMSPEQIRGRKPGPASDQYSLAIMIWEMLSGRPVFEGRTWDEVSNKHLGESPGYLRLPGHSINDEGYRRVHGALLRALSKKPEQRFASCREFVQSMAVPAEVQGVGGQAQSQAPSAGTDGTDPLRFSCLGSSAVFLAVVALVGYWRFS